MQQMQILCLVIHDFDSAEGINPALFHTEDAMREWLVEEYTPDLPKPTTDVNVVVRAIEKQTGVVIHSMMVNPPYDPDLRCECVSEEEPEQNG